MPVSVACIDVHVYSKSLFTHSKNCFVISIENTIGFLGSIHTMVKPCAYHNNDIVILLGYVIDVLILICLTENDVISLKEQIIHWFICTINISYMYIYSFNAIGLVNGYPLFQLFISICDIDLVFLEVPV